MRTSIRFLIVSSAALALAGCGKKEEAPAAAPSDAMASSDAGAAPLAAATEATPGIYEVADAAGKKVSSVTIRADGTFATDLADGHRVAGIVKMVDGKTCFDPSGKAPQECYTDSTPAADGNFTATDAKGVVLTVHPKAK